MELRVKEKKSRFRIEKLEERIAPAVWIVTPPGVGETVVQQQVPDAAVEGLTIGAARANAAQDATCWVVLPTADR